MTSVPRSHPSPPPDFREHGPFYRRDQGDGRDRISPGVGFDAGMRSRSSPEWGLPPECESADSLHESGLQRGCPVTRPHQRERPARGVPSEEETPCRASLRPTENPLKNLSELQYECATLGINVPTQGRPSKEPYIVALQAHHWQESQPDQPLPPQVHPMLLSNWADLDPEEARRIEDDGPGWVVSPKLDGVRALLHVEDSQVRITSRCVSEVNYRLGEFQVNLPHLTTGLDRLDGTVLDGELVFPASMLDTGRAIARHPLQAVTAILSTSPEQAKRLQSSPEQRVRFHAFDILKSNGTEVTSRPLRDRLDFLAKAIDAADNPYLETVPIFTIGRLDIHRRILESGGEGTVWKQLDQPYEPGRRVGHWIKRKRETTIEAIVTGFKPGTPGHGHETLVGALEFGTCQTDGSIRPIAWVSAWSDPERSAMSQFDSSDFPTLNPAYLNRRALIAGQDESARSGRLRHARLRRWLD